MWVFLDMPSGCPQDFHVKATTRNHSLGMPTRRHKHTRVEAHFDSLQTRRARAFSPRLGTQNGTHNQLSAFTPRDPLIFDGSEPPLLLPLLLPFSDAFPELDGGLGRLTLKGLAAFVS